MSEDPDTFSTLARKLSTDERKELFDRLNSRSLAAGEPLIELDMTDSTVGTVDDHYSRLGLFRRVILAIRSMFAHRDMHALVEEDLLSRLGRTIAQHSPEVYQHRTATFGPGLFRAFDRLRTACSILQGPLRNALAADKKEFLGYLGSVLAPVEHEKLLFASDPASVDDRAVKNDFELRRAVQIAVRDALDAVEKASRNRLYAMYRALLFLGELIQLPLLRSAGQEPAPPGGVPAGKYRKDLSELCDVVYSLRVPPSVESIEAVLRFARRDDEVTERFDDELSAAVDAIAEIRRLCKTIPLLDLVRLLNRNTTYLPDVLGGGEEWFSYFRQYWEQRAELLVDDLVRARRNDAFEREARVIVGDVDEHSRRFENYHNREGEQSIRVRFPETADFLLAFSDRVYDRHLSKLLKLFLMNGEFYKSTNREQMTDAYRGLEALVPALLEVDQMMSPDGDPGGTIARIEAEPIPGAVRRKRVGELVLRVDDSMEHIVRGAMGHLDTMHRVVQGILYGESGGAYDTLMNLGSIGGVENKSLAKRLDQALATIEATKRLLHEVFDFERDRG